MTKSIFILSIVAILFAACTTDVELNADYDSKTVIYGLLDQSADTQFIKINKTFIGEGNNILYAGIRDSIEYDNLDARIDKLDENDNVVDSHQLSETLKHNKSEDGIFATPTYKVYYTTAELDADFNYKIVVQPEGEPEVHATTGLITNVGQETTGDIFGNFANLMLEFNLASIIANQVQLNNRNIEWLRLGGMNAERFELIMRFHYRELLWTDANHTNLVSSELKYLDMPITTEESTKPVEQSETFEVEINGLEFFTYLSNNLTVDPTVTRLAAKQNVQNTDDPRFYDFYLTAGNDELNTYININSPVTGIVQEKPEYSNVINGIGLFAAKTTYKIWGKTSHKRFVEALRAHPLTTDLNFCSDHVAWNFNCPE